MMHTTMSHKKGKLLTFSFQKAISKQFYCHVLNKIQYLCSCIIETIGLLQKRDKILGTVCHFIYFHHIRIYHECEGRIEKSVPRIAVCHHEASRVMTNSDPEGQIFLSYPHTNNGFFFLLTTVFLFENKLQEVPEYAKMQFHMMKSLKHNNDVT